MTATISGSVRVSVAIERRAGGERPPSTSNFAKMMVRMGRPTVVLFGDSITQLGFTGGSDSMSPGWVGFLANAYTRRADILSRGFSGYNTRHALDILPSVFGQVEGDNASSYVGQPLFVMVFFGANDASLLADTEHCQHVPIEEFEGNTRKIVQAINGRFPASAKPPIFLITPPPVSQTMWDKYCTDQYGEVRPRTNEASKQYGDRVKSVAKHLGCSVVDSFMLLEGNKSEDTYGKYLEDGLHLNGLGNKALFNGVMDCIRSNYPDLAPMEGDGKTEEKGIPVDGALWEELC